MKRSTRRTVFLMALAFTVAGAAQAEEGRIGEAEFMKNCAVCHGTGGKGDGPIVDFLKQAPPDLTRLSRNNGGQFPMQRVYDTIVDAGRTRAHGTREMPIWGDRYSEEVIAEYGPYGAGPKATIRARVLELVFFLANIQE